MTMTTLREEHRRSTILAIAVLAFVVALALAVALWGQQQQPMLGTLLYAAGYHGVIGLCSGNVVCRGEFDPTTFSLSNDPTTGPTRYHWPDHSIGYTYGPEGTSAEAIQAAIDSGCMMVPGLPPHYVVQPWDRIDLLNIDSGLGPRSSLYVARVLPCQSHTEPTPSPTSEPTPAPTATPAPTPCAPGCVPIGFGQCACPTPTPVPTPEPTPQPTATPCPTAAPCPPPPAVHCTITPLSPRALQTLRVAPNWTLIEQRKAWLRQLAAEIAAQRCEVTP